MKYVHVFLLLVLNHAFAGATQTSALSVAFDLRPDKNASPTSLLPATLTIQNNLQRPVSVAMNPKFLPQFEFIASSPNVNVKQGPLNIDASYATIPPATTLRFPIDLGDFFRFERTGKARIGYKARLIYFENEDWSSPKRIAMEGAFEIDITAALLEQQRTAREQPKKGLQKAE